MGVKKNKQPQLSEWRKSKDTPVEVVVDDGDIFAPLKKVRDQYHARATRIATLHTDPETNQIPQKYLDAIEANRTSYGRVGALIPEEEVYVIEDQDVSVAAQQGDSENAGQDVQGSTSPDLGDNISEAVGSSQVEAGSVNNKDPYTDISGPSTDQVVG